MAAINPPVNAEFQVLKFGRSGSPRSISLQISNGDLVWRSKQLSLKFGKINRGEILLWFVYFMKNSM